MRLVHRLFRSVLLLACLALVGTVDLEAAAWKTQFHPGQFGKKRDAMFRSWDQRFGKGNWRVRWLWGDRALSLAEALRMYENGYYQWFRRNPERVEWLLARASDVYDNDPSNVKAGFDYFAQETSSNHYQDVAIRRALRRLKKRFRGDHLVEIRGQRSEGGFLSPGEIPFHRPEMIHDTWFDWWKKGSIEDFWQRNKVLVARRPGGKEEVVDRPGFIGSRWKQLEERWNRQFGSGAWRLAYEVEGRIISRSEALKLYEDAYVEWFRAHPEKLEWLVTTARDVYDHEPADVASGLDYQAQHGKATHLQDIAVRRALGRLGRSFQGERLIQMRGHDSPAGFLSPGELPFHRPELIRSETRFLWWKKGSIEDFYQSNKILQLRTKD